MQTRLLAVYGTLKKGYYNYTVYLKGYKSIFEGFVNIQYKLYTNGRYPMIVKSQDMSNVYLEVYEVDEDKFNQIYKLEEPFGYHSDIIEISEINENVNIFVFSDNFPPDEFVLVSDGNWKSTVPWNDK